MREADGWRRSGMATPVSHTLLCAAFIVHSIPIIAKYLVCCMYVGIYMMCIYLYAFCIYCIMYVCTYVCMHAFTNLSLAVWSTVAEEYL